MIPRTVTVTITDCLYCPHVKCEDFRSDEPVWVCQLKNKIIPKDKLGYLVIPDFCPLDIDASYVEVEPKPVVAELEQL